MAQKVDIRGIDKVVLLYALWSNMEPSKHFGPGGTGFCMVPPPSFNRSKAADAVKTYIDYYDGRCIKTDLSGDSVNPYLYDRDAGQGAFARIVAGFRG